MKNTYVINRISKIEPEVEDAVRICHFQESDDATLSYAVGIVDMPYSVFQELIGTIVKRGSSSVQMEAHTPHKVVME